MARRKKLLIIDGYNVLRSQGRYEHETIPDFTDDLFNRAREHLINDVINYAEEDTEAIIVFDGAHNRYSTGDPQIIGGVRIIFSPAGQSADKVIEKLAYDARVKAIETMVVTSDASIQDTVFGRGCDRMSAQGFSSELDRYYHEAQQDTLSKGVLKNTVARRLDVDTLAKLHALRDRNSK